MAQVQEYAPLLLFKNRLDYNIAAYEPVIKPYKKYSLYRVLTPEAEHIVHIYPSRGITEKYLAEAVVTVGESKLGGSQVLWQNSSMAQPRPYVLPDLDVADVGVNSLSEIKLLNLLLDEDSNDSIRMGILWLRIVNRMSHGTIDDFMQAINFGKMI